MSSRRFAPLALVALVAVAACDHSHDDTPPMPRVLVMNQNDGTLAVVDAQAGRVARTVDLATQGVAAGAKPHMAHVHDGVWVVSLIGANEVVVMDTTGRILRRAATPSPGMIAMAPDGRWAVSRSLTATNPPSAIAYIDPATMAVEERLVGAPHPHAIGHAGDYVYTASLRAPSLIRIAADGTVRSQTVPGGTSQALGHLALSPDGRRLALSAELTGQVHLYTIGTDGTPLHDATLDVGSRPWHLHFSPDGKTLYVPLFGADAVAVVDVTRRTVTRTVTGYGLAQPYTAAVSDDGRWLYVTNVNGNHAYSTRSNGTLVVIDTQTFEVVRTVEVGVNPTGATVLGSMHMH